MGIAAQFRKFLRTTFPHIRRADHDEEMPNLRPGDARVKD